MISGYIWVSTDKQNIETNDMKSINFAKEYFGCR
jgi:hypothetical protein